MLKVVSYLLRRHYSNQNLSARGQKASLYCLAAKKALRMGRKN
jgi:hypothetical protein